VPPLPLFSSLVQKTHGWCAGAVSQAASLTRPPRAPPSHRHHRHARPAPRPGVDMAADRHYFVRLFAAHDLAITSAESASGSKCASICRCTRTCWPDCVRCGSRWIFNRNRGRRDLWIGIRVAQRARMRIAQTAWGDRPDQRRHCAQPCGSRRAGSTIGNRLPIADERSVVEHDLALHPARPSFSSSSKVDTATTSAVIPPFGVPMLSPNPSMKRDLGA